MRYPLSSLGSQVSSQELIAFVGNPRLDIPKGLPSYLTEYLILVDVTGRAIRADKRGFINASELTMLQRFGLIQNRWFTFCNRGFKRIRAVFQAQ